MRAEASVSLTLAWDPRKPVEAKDVPVVRSFLAAVKSMMQVPSTGLRIAGPLSTLEAAFEARMPEETVALEERPLARDQRVARERELIREALTACGGNRNKAARRLGLPYRTIHHMIDRYGLRAEFPASRGRTPMAIT
jgi:transcriptional regulator with GAF, ATPase, and Fis domain